MRRRDFVTQVGTTVVLALGLSLLAVPTSLNAQKAAGIKRVGWLEVCAPGSQASAFRYFPGSPGRTRLRRGKKPRSSSSDLQIANTAGWQGWPPT